MLSAASQSLIARRRDLTSLWKEVIYHLPRNTRGGTTAQSPMPH